MIRALRFALTAVMAAGLLVAAPVAHAGSSQHTMLQDDPKLFTDPGPTFQRLRLLGVDLARVSIRWSWIAPNGLSHKRPSHFNATDPAAYPRNNWVPLDNLVREAADQGVPLNFNVTGGAPLWAEPPGAPNDGKVHADWQPSGRELGYFVTALATRYSGNYDPSKKRVSRGDPNDLPAVHFWSI
jgi:hypothetical protein